MNIPDILELIMQEYTRASSKFGPFSSPHEGIGIIREEYLELEKEVFKRIRTRELMLPEAIQLGAMAVRFIFDLCNDREP